MSHRHAEKPLRIAFLIGQLGYGGSERQLYTILRHMDPKLYRSIVIVFNPSPHRAFDGPLVSLGVEVHHVPKQSRGVLRRTRYVYQVLKEFSPDIVHSWSVYDNTYAGLVGRITGTFVRLGSLRGSIHLSGFHNFPRLYRWLSLYSVSKLTVNARSIAQELLHIGYPEDRVVILQNCVETAQPLAPPDLREYGIDDQQLLIGTVGNLRAVKNQALFVEGMAKVVTRFPDIRGVIVGQPIPGEERLPGQLEKQIRGFGLEGKVVLLGFRSDVPALMQRFSIFCLTSDSEGTPNSILEAMAASRPVVATQVGGIPDIVADGVSGMLFNPGDSDELANKLVQLLENPNMRDKMGQVGRQVAESNFSCQHAIEQLTNLYQRSFFRKHRSKTNSQSENLCG